jgi:hypothetical protein
MENKTERDAVTGQYKHDGNWDRPCRCGHSLGVHSAEQVKGKRPCQNGDTGDDCDCQKFRPKK